MSETYKDIIYLIAMHNPRMFKMRRVCKNWNTWLHDERFMAKWEAKHKVTHRYFTELGGIIYDGFRKHPMAGFLGQIDQYEKGYVICTYTCELINPTSHRNQQIYIYKRFSSKMYYCEHIRKDLLGWNLTPVFRGVVSSEHICLDIIDSVEKMVKICHGYSINLADLSIPLEIKELVT